MGWMVQASPARAGCPGGRRPGFVACSSTVLCGPRWGRCAGPLRGVRRTGRGLSFALVTEYEGVEHPAYVHCAVARRVWFAVMGCSCVHTGSM